MPQFVMLRRALAAVSTALTITSLPPIERRQLRRVVARDRIARYSGQVVRSDLLTCSPATPVGR